jgi:hypothetical protein
VDTNQPENTKKPKQRMHVEAFIVDQSWQHYLATTLRRKIELLLEDPFCHTHVFMKNANVKVVLSYDGYIFLNVNALYNCMVF